MIEYTIPHKLPSLNDYIDVCRGNRYGGNSFKTDTESLIALYLKPNKTVTKPVYIMFEWHEKTRRRDKDNVCFAKKFILDAMQKSGVLPNDNNRYVLGFTDSFVYDGTSKVIVRIEV